MIDPQSRQRRSPWGRPQCQGWEFGELWQADVHFNQVHPLDTQGAGVRPAFVRCWCMSGSKLGHAQRFFGASGAGRDVLGLNARLFLDSEVSSLETAAAPKGGASAALCVNHVGLCALPVCVTDYVIWPVKAPLSGNPALAANSLPPRH